MYEPVDPYPLFIPTLILAATSSALLAPYIGRITAVVAATVKFGISLVYFVLPDSPYWILGDSISYYEDSLALTDVYSLWELIFPPSGFGILVSEIDSQHIFYHWWNITTVTLFGRSFHAPILGNVFVSVLTGVLFYHLLIEAGKSETYARYGTVFFLLHWDVLAWSGLMNLKDTLVMFFTVLIFVYILKLSRRDSTRAVVLYVVGVGLGVTALLYLRFYVNGLILAATGAWFVMHLEQFKSYHLAFLLPAVWVVVRWAEKLERLTFDTMLFGLYRFPLTPRPWHVAPNYTFVQLPAVFHWLFFVPALYAGARLFIHSKHARLVLLYLGIAVVFYSLLPNLWGVRHRYQTVFIWAWMQFHFLWIVRGTVSFDDSFVGRLADARA